MSLEVYYRPSDKITIKLECKDIKEVFEDLGPLQEVMGACQCGREGCGSKNIRFGHRVDEEKHNYYELICENCGAKLTIGQEGGGKLFPRRYELDPEDHKKALLKDGKKVWLPHGGWQKWDSKQNKYV